MDGRAVPRWEMRRLAAASSGIKKEEKKEEGRKRGGFLFALEHSPCLTLFSCPAVLPAGWLIKVKTVAPRHHQQHHNHQPPLAIGLELLLQTFTLLKIFFFFFLIADLCSSGSRFDCGQMTFGPKQRGRGWGHRKPADSGMHLHIKNRAPTQTI